MDKKIEPDGPIWTMGRYGPNEPNGPHEPQRHHEPHRPHGGPMGGYKIGPWAQEGPPGLKNVQSVVTYAHYKFHRRRPVGNTYIYILPVYRE